MVKESANVPDSHAQNNETRASGLFVRLRSLGPIIGVIVLVVVLLTFSVSVYQIFDESRMPCSARDWDPAACLPFEEALFVLGLSPTSFAGYFLFLQIVAAVPFFVTSGALLLRKSRSTYGLFLAVFVAVLGAAGTWFNPLWSWAGDWLEDIMSAPARTTILGLLTVALYAGALIFLFTYPRGRFISRITRWLVVLWLPLAFILGFFPDSPLSVTNWPQPLSALVPLILLIGSLWVFVYRYRHSSVEERQQHKWVVFTFLLLGLIFVVDFSVWELIPALTDTHLITIGMSSVVWELIQDSAWYLAQLAFGIALLLTSTRSASWGDPPEASPSP
jgi:hypothetical protein